MPTLAQSGDSMQIEFARADQLRPGDVVLDHHVMLVVQETHHEVVSQPTLDPIRGFGVQTVEGVCIHVEGSEDVGFLPAEQVVPRVIVEAPDSVPADWS